MIEETLGMVTAGHDLSMEQMDGAIDVIMQGSCPEGEIGLFLTALSAKGETADEVAGAAAAMRKHMTKIHTRRTDFIDTCGTGGDGSGTFNISTAAALVTAAAGAAVAKHGNRSITSKTGSADVLTQLGVNIEADTATIEKCLDELGICFCFAPQMHPAMKHVGPVRKKLGVPTIFNMLGPLCNPAGAPFQLIGVGKPKLRQLLSQALAKLGTRRALVVHGADGLDEVSLAGLTDVSEITDGNLCELTWTPADFGLEEAGSESMLVDDPASSARMIRDILDGRPSPSRDIVVLNAAAALWTAGKDESPKVCAKLAAEAIDCGAASELLAKWAQATST